MGQDESNKHENHEIIENELFEEIQHVLQFSEKRDGEILQLFGLGSTVASVKNARYERCSEKQFLNLNQIKSLSIRFRLRFLKAELYTGEIPYEVIFALRNYEHQYIDKTISYFILAPAPFFLNRDKFATPLVFALTENGNYEMICKWGKKLPILEPILRYPFRNFKSMITSSVIFGFVVAIFTTFAGFLNYDSAFKSILMKVPIIVLSSGLFSTFALCYGLITRTDFSNENWNSRIKKIS